jgi:hypothetical protein
MATEQIRTEEPVKNTIHNLIQTLSVKLDSAARSATSRPLCAATGSTRKTRRKDGFDDCAELFARMAETEQPQAAHRRLRGRRVTETPSPAPPEPGVPDPRPGPEPEPKPPGPPAVAQASRPFRAPDGRLSGWECSA